MDNHESRQPVASMVIIATPRKRKLHAIAGTIYLIFSLVVSFWYFDILQPSFANDLWWPHYNVSGHQAFLIDLVNQFLASHTNGTLDLLGSSSLVQKTYSSTEPTTNIYSPYMYNILLGKLIAVEYAVGQVRRLSTYWCMRVNVQHCWVDFNKTFEMAHTSLRQQRCRDRYKDNAAVYMEAILRNQPWQQYLKTWGGNGLRFNVAIQRALEESQQGRDFLAQMAVAYNTTTVDEELAYWRMYKFTYFQLQWQNRWQPGITETIFVENALGMQQQYTLKMLNQVSGPWTSQHLFWMPLNDLFNAMLFNRSFVRSGSRFFGSSNNGLKIIDLEAYHGVLGMNTSMYNLPSVFHNTIGPYISIDSWNILPLPSLLDAVNQFKILLFDQIRASPALWQSFTEIPEAVVYPTPAKWQNKTYYGGDITCTVGLSTNYVQDQFNFSNDCAHRVPFGISLTKVQVLFALASRTPNASSYAPCRLQQSTVCTNIINAAMTLANQLVFPINLTTATVTDVKALNVSIIQYTLPWQLQQKRLLGTDEDWNFYGWCLLFDWAHGVREVISFEGDISSIVAISGSHSGQKYAIDQTSLQNATQSLYFLVVVTSGILAFVGVLALIFIVLTRLHIVGANLFSFNRVVGSIWIGRPLMITRGLTALLVLSTSQLALDTTVDGRFSYLRAHKRPVVQTLVIAGEATWVTYALNDVLLIWLSRRTSVTYSPLSSLLVWVSYSVLEFVVPVEPVVTIDQVCNGIDLDYQVICTAGVVQIGSKDRLICLCIIQIVVVLCTAFFSSIYLRRRRVDATTLEPSMLLPGAATAFLTPVVTQGKSQRLDKVACVLTGLLPYQYRDHSYLMVLKSWMILKDVDFKEHDIVLKSPTLSLGSSHVIPSLPSPQSFTTHISQIVHSLHQAWSGVLIAGGLFYMLVSIGTSASYFEVSQVHLANDLFWPKFNMSGYHAFFASWLNEQLVLGLDKSQIQLNNISINLLGRFSSAQPTIITPNNYANLLQHRSLNSIAHAISGLRNSDAQLLPWIATAYCYLDFNQHWEMAYSSLRQLRCKDMTTNGAVFLEAILRNVDWTDWSAAWSDAFRVGFEYELVRTIQGQQWLIDTKTADLSVSDEIAFWSQHGITTFDVQWQNYKRVGIANSYSIMNAYGLQYPMLLTTLKGSFRLDQQSTFKTYWAFANDLAAITTNTSGIAGGSLLRISPQFAFQNTSLESVFYTYGILTAPLSCLAITRSKIGPFGVIDMIFIPPPTTLTEYTRYLLDMTRSAISNSTVQAIYNAITPLATSYPVPQVWLTPNYPIYGGTPLCEQYPTGVNASSGLSSLFSYDYSCVVAPRSRVNPTRQHLITSAILSGLAFKNGTSGIARVCKYDPTYYSSCLVYLNQTINFIQTFMPAANTTTATKVHQDAMQYNISFMIFTKIRPSTSFTMLQTNVIDPNDPEFWFFGWTYLYDWVLGFREVVAIQGDYGSMTLLTDQEPPLAQPVQAWQNSSNAARYCRAAVWYVTCVMILVATLVSCYLVLSRGYVQGLNMFELCRVGGIIWVGRPLLFLRGTTALCMLSTGTVELVYSGYLTYFTIAPTPWYKTWLAAGEVTWLVAVVNDILLIATKEYSAYYVTINSFLVWLTVGVWTTLNPVDVDVAIDQRCSITEMDFQIECTNGSIAIGQPRRLYILGLIIVTWNLVSFSLVKKFLVTRPRKELESFLLSPNATYLFYHTDRFSHGVYYLDRASAALDGILTIRLGATIYSLDIKLWRLFVISVPSGSTPQSSKRLQSCAYPVTD